MKEEWRPILDGDYAVSSLGRVKRVARGHGARVGKLRKLVLASDGYLEVGIRGKNYPVCQLVALAFIGPRPQGKEPNHKNGKRLDNRAKNLEYLTHEENVKHASKMGLMASGDMHYSRRCPELVVRGSRNGMALLTDEKVTEIRKSTDVSVVSKIRRFSKKFHVSEGAIGAVWYGRTWKHLL